MVNSMDCNRDEAVRCCEIGREHIRHGRRAEALKMFKKSEALYPNTDASTWIQQLESATTTPTSSPSNTSTPPSSTNSRPSRLKLVDSLYRQYDFLAKNVAMFVNQIEPAHRKPLLFLLVVIVILLACRILVGSPRFLFQYFGMSKLCALVRVQRA